MVNHEAPQKLIQILKSKNETPETIPTSGEDWRALIRLANIHQVRSLVYYRLQEKGLLNGVPQTVADHLKRDYLMIAGRNSILLQDHQELVDLLNQNGVPNISLKGIHFIRSVYSEVSLRELADIDLLVPKNQLQKSIELIRSIGFETYRPINWDLDIKKRHQLPVFTNHNQTNLEIHHSISSGEGEQNFDSNELWLSKSLYNHNGFSYHSLSPEMTILYHCYHTTNQHLLNHGFRPYCDLDQILNTCGDLIDWDVIITRSRQYGWERNLYLTLKLANALLGVEITDFLISRVDNAAYDETFFQALDYLQSENYFLSHIPISLEQSTRLRSQADFGNWIKKIFPSRNNISEIYTISPSSPKIYIQYFIYWFDLLRKFRNYRNVMKNNPEIIKLSRFRNDLTNWVNNKSG